MARSPFIGRLRSPARALSPAEKRRAKRLRFEEERRRRRRLERQALIAAGIPAARVRSTLGDLAVLPPKERQALLARRVREAIAASPTRPITGKVKPVPLPILGFDERRSAPPSPELLAEKLRRLEAAGPPSRGKTIPQIGAPLPGIQK